MQPPVLTFSPSKRAIRKIINILHIGHRENMFFSYSLYFGLHQTIYLKMPVKKYIFPDVKQMLHIAHC